MANLHAESPEWGSNEQLSSTEDARAEVLNLLSSENFLSFEAPSIESKFFQVRPLRDEVKAFNLLPKRELFGSFWKERELAILVGATGSGKSLLAVQIAAAISEGREVGGFGCKAGAQPVLYLDFENGIEDHTERAADYDFAHNLLRVSFNGDASPEEFASQVVPEIRSLCVQTGARAVIIDNISWLFADLNVKTDIHQASGALLKNLNLLRQSEGIAVLVVAHTNKDKGFTPFSLADVSGSSNITRYAERVFALARSYRDDKERYLKVLKARSAGGEFTSHKHVAAMEIGEVEGLVHLLRKPHLDGVEANFIRDAVEQKGDAVRELLAESPEMSTKEIAEALGVAPDYVRKIKRGER